MWRDGFNLPFCSGAKSAVQKGPRFATVEPSVELLFAGPPSSSWMKQLASCGLCPLTLVRRFGSQKTKAWPQGLRESVIVEKVVVDCL